MRLVSLLALVLVVSACGSAGSGGARGTSEPKGEAVATGGGTASVGMTDPAPIDESNLKPPQIVLRSPVGDQPAVLGSSCVEYVDPASDTGTAVCGDSAAVHPEAVTVVMPGDKLTFAFRDAEIVRSKGCSSGDEQDCIGTVVVRPLGCEGREVERVPLALGPQTRWTVDLATGGYQLDVFGNFESGSGATGDVSGTLGLYVGGGPKEYDALGVTAIKPAMQVCRFPL
jgi:hypothetical protein